MNTHLVIPTQARTQAAGGAVSGFGRLFQPSQTQPDAFDLVRGLTTIQRIDAAIHERALPEAHRVFAYPQTPRRSGG